MSHRRADRPARGGVPEREQCCRAPVRISRPSGENSACQMSPPSRMGAPTGSAGDGVPDPGRALPIVDDRTSRPSGEKATPLTDRIMPRQGLDLSASGRLPEPDRPIVARGHDPRAIGREPGNIDGAAVPERRPVESRRVATFQSRAWPSCPRQPGRAGRRARSRRGLGRYGTERRTEWPSGRGLPESAPNNRHPRT